MATALAVETFSGAEPTNQYSVRTSSRKYRYEQLTVGNGGSVDEPVSGLALGLVSSDGSGISHDNGVVATELNSAVRWGQRKTGHRLDLYNRVRGELWR